MKLTAFTDHSLRVLIYLVAVPQRRATVAEIGAALDIKPNHLSKVVHHLGRCGWIETTRGKGGGLTLARGADDIVVGDVVRDAEGPLVPAECFSAHGAGAANACAIARCCQLKGVLGEAVDAFYGVLDAYTLADITRNPRALADVLRLQPRAAPPPRRTRHAR